MFDIKQRAHGHESWAYLSACSSSRPAQSPCLQPPSMGPIVQQRYLDSLHLSKQKFSLLCCLVEPFALTCGKMGCM